MTSYTNEVLNKLEGKSYIIGREGHIYVSDPAASKLHAELQITGGKIRIRDLGSTNGVYLEKAGRSVRIEDGYVVPQQTITIGKEQHRVQNLLELIDSFLV